MPDIDAGTPVTPEAIEALLRFLPELESPDFDAGTWRGGEADQDGVVHMPWFELSDEASAFVGELGRGGWIVAFDWGAWADEGRRLIDGGLEEAGLEDIRRLLTALVRSDRFSEGQLAWAFESGLMVRVLRRLRELTT